MIRRLMYTLCIVIGFVSTLSAQLVVDIHDPSRACAGTTLLADLHDQQNPRIIEIDMQGNIRWQYAIPEELKTFIDPGLDVEYLDNDRILFVLPRKGIYEIDRDGNVRWSHLDPQVSHDADRLPNGNTLYVYGAGDSKLDDHVKEVKLNGDLFWSWSARDLFDNDQYGDIAREGWTHANSVTRLANENTLVNLRNFSLTVIISPDGELVRSIDWTELVPTESPFGLDPHEPEIQSGNRLLVCLQRDTPYQVVEIDIETGELFWTYHREGLRTARDADRLPGGNTLIVGVLEPNDESVVFEVTPEGDVVWQYKVTNRPATDSPGWFFNAERKPFDTGIHYWPLFP